MKSFYEQKITFFRVAGNVNRCYRVNFGLRKEEWDGFMVIECLHERSSWKNLVNSEGEESR